MDSIKARIEKVLSDILSRKHDAKITIKFEKKEKDDETRSIKEK